AELGGGIYPAPDPLDGGRLHRRGESPGRHAEKAERRPRVRAVLRRVQRRDIGGVARYPVQEKVIAPTAGRIEYLLCGGPGSPNAALDSLCYLIAPRADAACVVTCKRYGHPTPVPDNERRSRDRSCSP